MTLQVDSEDEFRAQFTKDFKEHAKKVGRFNIAVFGKTGVGKSTLINAIFGERIAATGIGEPITKAETMYVHHAGCLGLFDAPGLEVGRDGERILSDLSKILKAQRKKPLAEQIHLAWYCVRAADLRFEEIEESFIRELHKLGLPVLLVMTQVHTRDGRTDPRTSEFATKIRERNLPLAIPYIFLTMAERDRFSSQEQFGLQQLLNATFQVAPERVHPALISVQVIDMERKRAEAGKTIAVSAGLASVAAATPIPVADAAALVPIQLGMLARIAHIYGADVDTAQVAALAATALAVQGGRALAGSLLKMIPGFGTLVGAAINTTVAFSLTTAMGWAWVAVCDQGYLAGMNGVLDNALVRKIFTQEFKQQFSTVALRR